MRAFILSVVLLFLTPVPAMAQDTPQAEVSLLLPLIFEKTDYLTTASAQGAKISKRSGLRGITIPVHAGATQYFGTTAAPPTKDAQTVPQKGKGAAK